MARRKFGLTLRQAQALTCIAYRKTIFSVVRFSDLITDMGVSFVTLADHLGALKKRGLIRTQAKYTRNLDFSDEITITRGGDAVASLLMQKIGATYGNETMPEIFARLRNMLFEPEPKTVSGQQIDLLFNKTTTRTSFAKAFNKLVIENPTEPVLTSIAMYTDLDSQLVLIHLKDKEKYKILSRARLNLEIRNGRLASIAIPAAIRGTSRFEELSDILAGSWSWMATVASRSERRYWQEATYLGLIQINGDSVISLKQAPVDTLKWLSDKTNFTFINTIPVAPKIALVLYREALEFLPTEEDLLDPKNSNLTLPWLNTIRDGMNNTALFKKTVHEGLRILKDDSTILQSYEGRLIPTSVYRKIKSIPELNARFETIMKHQDTTVANILIAINQKPAITVGELCQDLNKHSKHKITVDDVWDMASLLIPSNLVQTTSGRSAAKEDKSFFSFIHIPFLEQTNTSRKQTNAVLRSIKPYLLHLIKELFVKDDERRAVYNIFNDLMKKDYKDFESIEREYSKNIERKIVVISRLLEPFVAIDKDYNGISLNKDTTGLNKVLIDSLLYSVLTQNDGLAIYNNAIAALVEKDKPWATDIENEVQTLTTALIKEQKILP
jgi:DNA-binding MarR family transcriptional regulator